MILVRELVEGRERDWGGEREGGWGECFWNIYGVSLVF